MSPSSTQPSNQDPYVLRDVTSSAGFRVGSGDKRTDVSESQPRIIDGGAVSPLHVSNRSRYVGLLRDKALGCLPAAADVTEMPSPIPAQVRWLGEKLYCGSVRWQCAECRAPTNHKTSCSASTASSSSSCVAGKHYCCCTQAYRVPARATVQQSTGCSAHVCGAFGRTIWARDISHVSYRSIESPRRDMGVAVAHILPPRQTFLPSQVGAAPALARLEHRPSTGSPGAPATIAKNWS